MDFLKNFSKPTLVFFNILLLVSFSYFTFAYFYTELQSAKRNCAIKYRPKEASNCLTNSSGSTSTQLTVPNQPRLAKEFENSEESLFTILLWTWPLGRQFPLNRCPDPVNYGCFYTVNRSAYSTANAVVISHRDVYWSEELLPPVTRPPQQYWVWLSLESPSNCPNLTLMDNKMNFTMSYRVDSDLYHPYGFIEKANEKENFIIPQKSKLVAWVVSNWKSKHRRTTYCEELKKYIPVDVYGRNALTLQRNETLQTLAKYKFYLAFENSMHEDYITEKLWKNSLTAGNVPVVMGPPRENYERFIPPDSFIHVDDFSGPQELAEYLLSLDKDEERYRQYFNWRMKYQPSIAQDSFLYAYCQLCRLLKEAPIYRKGKSISEWFR